MCTWEVIQFNLHLKYQKVLSIILLVLSIIILVASDMRISLNIYVHLNVTKFARDFIVWEHVIFSHVTKLSIIAQMLALPLAL